jgi:acyl-CoA synthetase (AMP-forming)/AMP-acid ligase II
MRVEEFLRDSARRLPAKTAIVAGKKRVTFGELDRKSDRFAEALATQGVGRGDRIVFFMDTYLPAVIAIFGVLKAGAVSASIDPSTTADDLATVLNNCRAAGIVTEARLATTAARAMIGAPSVKLAVLSGGDCSPQAVGCLNFEEVIGGMAIANPPVAPGADTDAAFMVDASESVRLPEAAALTHLEAVAAVASTDIREDTVVQGVLPFSSGRGLNQMLGTVRAGATLVLEEPFAFPQALLNRVGRRAFPSLGSSAYGLVPQVGAQAADAVARHERADG